ncbi:YfiT family bacillithiol transferase [Hymenobacter sp.]|uniref:YfiT family bacillithiol transferase n=1 Tax=Hymenobacter sp. TaxID=1898978 RepID=UPI00286CF337|nr:putative metal-dependent hydrolase [Hymenobacter sp.]
MEPTAAVDYRYPVGPLELPAEPLTAAQRRPLLEQLAALPAQLMQAVRDAGEIRLEQPYRPGGWSGRQVIHHLADAHQLGYLRFRLTLTEDQLSVAGYNQNAWTALPDVARTPVRVSLALLEALHTRWGVLLEQLSEEQWQRRFFQSTFQRHFTLNHALTLYAWHSRHHLGHVRLLAGQHL